MSHTPKLAKESHDLFSKVKSKYSQVIDQNENINLDDKSLVYTVGELQNFCITEIERDVIADAFETFIGYALKGGQGQFFTPRNEAATTRRRWTDSQTSY